jgi:hypothetical protein
MATRLGGPNGVRNPGLIAQMRGIRTTKRYKCITVFVDQATGYGFTHTQKSTSAEETIAAKEAFEMHLAAMGVVVSQYHADNGIFADNGFREACRQARKRLTFCGIKTHTSKMAWPKEGSGPSRPRPE